MVRHAVARVNTEVEAANLHCYAMVMCESARARDAGVRWALAAAGAKTEFAVANACWCVRDVGVRWWCFTLSNLEAHDVCHVWISRFMT